MLLRRGLVGFWAFGAPAMLLPAVVSGVSTTQQELMEATRTEANLDRGGRPPDGSERILTTLVQAQVAGTGRRILRRPTPSK